MNVQLLGMAKVPSLKAHKGFSTHALSSHASLMRFGQTTPPPPRRFSFGLRQLMGFVLMATSGLGWFINLNEHNQRKAFVKNNELIEELAKQAFTPVSPDTYDITHNVEPDYQNLNDLLAATHLLRKSIAQASLIQDPLNKTTALPFYGESFPNTEPVEFMLPHYSNRNLSYYYHLHALRSVQVMRYLADRPEPLDLETLQTQASALYQDYDQNAGDLFTTSPQEFQFFVNAYVFYLKNVKNKPTPENPHLVFEKFFEDVMTPYAQAQNMPPKTLEEFRVETMRYLTQMKNQDHTPPLVGAILSVMAMAIGVFVTVAPHPAEQPPNPKRKVPQEQ